MSPFPQGTPCYALVWEGAIGAFYEIDRDVNFTLIGDVMNELSDCVLKHRGVLVDYVGDELLAMWGAPEEQPDHARLCCLAALDIINAGREVHDFGSRYRAVGASRYRGG